MKTVHHSSCGRDFCMEARPKNTTAKLLDPTHARLSGQDRVNAEIFTAIEILGRKLERTEGERDRLARRLALIESAAKVDEKTGKLYLPVVVDHKVSPEVVKYAAPRWSATVSLMSSAIALFALGIVLFRPPQPTLSSEQIAMLDALMEPQFRKVNPESDTWQPVDRHAIEESYTLAEAPPQPAPSPIVSALPEVVPTPLPVEEIATAAGDPDIAETPSPEEPVVETAASVVAIAEDPVAPLDITKPAEEEKKPVTVLAAMPKEEPKPAPKTEPPKVAAKKTEPKKVAQEEVQKVAVEKAVTPAPEEMKPDQDLPESLADLERRALNDMPEAQHDLATLYASGRLVPQNYPRAIGWFKKAADGGVANAHYNLGVIYHQGLGVKADIRLALAWYEKAAELGHPEALYNLGIAYIEGIGTKPDVTKGIAFFKRAADVGVSQAAYNLGVLYESNFVGPIDVDKALEWYQKAAGEGHAEAKEALARLQGSSNPLTLADMVEPAGGEPHGEGDASPLDESSSKEEPAGNDLVRAIQTVLSAEGVIPGKPDGVMNMQTEDAIRAYQKKLGMPEDGMPSRDLLDRMLQYRKLLSD